MSDVRTEDLLRILDLLAAWEENPRWDGYVKSVSDHHFREPHVVPSVGGPRYVRQCLNELVRIGVLEVYRHDGYKTWKRAHGSSQYARADDWPRRFESLGGRA